MKLPWVPTCHIRTHCSSLQGHELQFCWQGTLRAHSPCVQTAELSPELGFNFLSLLGRSSLSLSTVWQKITKHVTIQSILVRFWRVLSGYKLSLWSDENVLEVDGIYGRTRTSELMRMFWNWMVVMVELIPSGWWEHYGTGQWWWMKKAFWPGENGLELENGDEWWSKTWNLPSTAVTMLPSEKQEVTRQNQPGSKLICPSAWLSISGSCMATNMRRKCSYK